MNIYTRAGNLIGNVTPVDETPTENSTNTVQSGGVYTAIEEIPTSESENPVISKASKNLIDVSKAVSGTLDSSGNVTPSDSYYVSEYIPVDANNTYISTNCGKFCAYDADKVFTASVNISTSIYASQHLAIPVYSP